MTQPNDEAPPQDDEPVAHPLNDNPWLKKMQALGESLEAGRITQAEFERKHRALMIELQAPGRQGPQEDQNVGHQRHQKAARRGRIQAAVRPLPRRVRRLVPPLPDLHLCRGVVRHAQRQGAGRRPAAGAALRRQDPFAPAGRGGVGEGSSGRRKRSEKAALEGEGGRNNRRATEVSK